MVPSPPIASNTIAFAAVPYVRVLEPLDLGPWRLWPNSKADWEREAGVDLTWFLEMYRNRDDFPIDAAGSVLTRAGSDHPTREQFRDAITALSSLAWLDGKPSADPWLFEVWNLPKDATPSDGFRRVGKFSVNHTDPETDRVRPSPYVFPITLRANLPELVTSFVESALQKGPDNPVLRSLGQLHEVRFETPYFTSLGNDIEALWTGFEALLLKNTKPGPSAGGLANRIWRAFQILFGSPKPKIRRSSRLAFAISEQLKVSGIRPETLAGINAFVERLWDARNLHSHGGHTEPPIVLEGLGTTALSAGLRLFPLLLKVRIARSANDEILMLASAVDQLNEIFLREPTIQSVVDLLSKEQGKNWYPPGPERRDEFLRLKAQLLDLVGFARVDGWAERREVAKARGFVRRVLTAWLKDLQASSPGNDHTVLANFPALDGATLKSLKAAGTSGTALEDALDKQLVDEAIASEIWRNPPPDPSLLGGAIPLWLWVRALVRLQELFLGHELV